MTGRVLVAGATGAVGSRLTPVLVGAGWQVQALVRGPRDAGRLPDGVEPVLADLLDPAVVAAVGDNDVIVHVASAIPTQRSAPPEAWRLNDRIRREGTRHLLAAAARSGARLVLQSVTMLYAEAGEDWIDASNAQLQPAANLTSMLDAERMVESSPVDSLVMRQGLLFGAHTGATAGLLAAVRNRTLPPISDRRVWLSLLDPEDFAATVVTALQRNLLGTYDAVSDTATITELITAAAEIISVEVPEAITLAEARERLDPGILSAWYVSRRVSAAALADHGISPQRTWPQMLNKTSGSDAGDGLVRADRGPPTGRGNGRPCSPSAQHLQAKQPGTLHDANEEAFALTAQSASSAGGGARARSKGTSGPTP